MYRRASAAGLYPTDDLAAAKVDAIMDSSTDFGINVRPSFMEKDAAKKVNTHKGRTQSKTECREANAWGRMVYWRVRGDVGSVTGVRRVAFVLSST